MLYFQDGIRHEISYGHMDATENKAPCLCLHGSNQQGQAQLSKGLQHNSGVPSEGTQATGLAGQGSKECVLWVGSTGLGS